MPRPDTRGPKGSARKVALWGAIFAVAAIYLFATRPGPLGEARASQGAVPIEKVFRILAAENDAARAMWTAEIVGAGVKAGLKFSEKWRQPDIDAGPLPALFLRESATAVQKTRVPLGLFLGSDYPIAPSNLFTGEQAEHFKRVRATGNPEFFHAADIGRSIGMFADYGVSPGCVSCHNEHPNSPKTDWKLKDMFGATTWSYPKDKVTVEEALQILGALRLGFAAAYDGYLAKVATFEKPPELGERWPRDGYYLPTREVFMRELERRASARTVEQLLHAFESAGPAK
jgi:adenylate cyclase